MITRIVFLTTALSFLLVGVAVSAGIAPGDSHLVERGASVKVQEGAGKIEGKITGIKGNVITLTDAKGVARRVEVKSVAGIKLGSVAWCEDDCRSLQIGNKIVNVMGVRK